MTFKIKTIFMLYSGYVAGNPTSCLWRARVGWQDVFSWTTHRRWKRIPPCDFQGCQGTPKDCFRPGVAEKSRALCQVQVCIL